MISYRDEDLSKHVATLKLATQQVEVAMVKSAGRAAAPYVRPRPDDKMPMISRR